MGPCTAFFRLMELDDAQHHGKPMQGQNAEQDSMQLPSRSPPDLAPCYAREKIVESTDPSPGNRRQRRKRAKAKKSRAAAAKRAGR